MSANPPPKPSLPQSLMPLLGLTGAMLGILVQRGSKISQDAYKDASAVAKEALGQMRAVAAYGGEEHFISLYRDALVPSTAAETKVALGAGLSIGSLWCVMFGTYGLALWYGSKLLLSGEYTGGQARAAPRGRALSLPATLTRPYTCRQKSREP